MRTASSPDAPSPQNAGVFVMALVQFGFSSVGMMIGNKMAMDYLKDPETGVALPSTLVTLQVIGTLALLFHFRHLIDHEKLNAKCIVSWLPIVTLFAGMLFTSAKTFQFVHVSFVIIIRNVGAIVTTIVEYFVRNTTVNARVLAAEVTIVIGTVVYGQEGLHHFQDFWLGLSWCLANVLCQTLYGVTLKYKMDHDPAIRDMSKYTMSLFNNLLCLPYVIVVALVSGEPAYFTLVLPQVSMTGWSVVVATCAIGFMISTSGFGLQKLVSATTFLVINNMTKILNIILGILFLKDQLPNSLSLFGCIVSLAGGFWYSYETKQLNAQLNEETRLARRNSAASRDVEEGNRKPVTESRHRSTSAAKNASDV
ncbi:GDP-mannose transporter GONST2 [Diplonema papillatum]|nr:GDP-mannose transporter GONST2 [Diplonema papillatum]